MNKMVEFFMIGVLWCCIVAMLSVFVALAIRIAAS